MAKKARKKQKNRYHGITTKDSKYLETQAQMRDKFPPSLIKAFVRIKETGFENEKLYNKYVKAARKYLGEKYEDKIESGRLIVFLSRATMDLF